MPVRVTGFLADGASCFSERGIAKRPRLTDRAPPDPAPTPPDPQTPERRRASLQRRGRGDREPVAARDRRGHARARERSRRVRTRAPSPVGSPARRRARRTPRPRRTRSTRVGPDATQADVYAHAIEPIVAETLEGFNCTVFAYGQTGTGKTHTMEGDDGRRMIGDCPCDDVAETAGIVPRALRQIFRHLETQSETEYWCGARSWSCTTRRSLIARARRSNNRIREQRILRDDDRVGVR